MRRIAVLGVAAAAGLEPNGVEEVVVLDPSADALLELLERVADPRWAYQLGGLPVLPLPDRSVDEVLGADDADPEVARVRR